MKIAIVYVFPTATPAVYEPMARRFVNRYMEHPPGATDHEFYVVINGSNNVTSRQRHLFYPLTPQFLYHDNSGKDIGAYQVAAQAIQCDVIMCIGTPVRPCQAGWLDWIVKGIEDNGPGLCGCWCFHVPSPHVRTTLFWTQREILNSYPHSIGTSKRYEFEFGRNSITQYCMKLGLPVLQVTAFGIFQKEQWHHVERDESIFLDQHCDKLNYKD